MARSISQPDNPSKRRLPILLRRSWFGMNQTFRRRIAHLGITPNHFTILRWLIEAGDEGLNHKCLCQRMASDPNTVAALVERLANEKLIRRRVDPDDRRARRLWIAKRGLDLYHQARPFAIDLQKQLLQAIPSRDRDKFLRQLEALSQACQDAAHEEIAAE